MKKARGAVSYLVSLLTLDLSSLSSYFDINILEQVSDVFAVLQYEKSWFSAWLSEYLITWILLDVPMRCSKNFWWKKLIYEDLPPVAYHVE